ncbi:hypothetical protein [Shewanella gaetbuli]|uniref:MotA/TolQ/ExbB proton channel domain-containing protein n=1 Tax=Shewanella gaetbuli TaxID=220752 RepID=A0A9X1ZKH1_9GAMM|nr:hypothetical protein [Shewanella gaetbuli]MCL1143216.1 hypothetical protein [Shewanella gaetbuli]
MFNNFTSGDLVTDLIISITVLIFCFFTIREILSSNRAKSQLQDLLKVKSNSDNNYLSMDSLNSAQRLWVTNHLIYSPKADFLEIESKGALWLSKTPISQMIPAYDPNRYKLVPALLTSIGITGTFLGITLGLSQFGMSGDSKALLASAAELLEGMKTAFYTSLAGLSTSAIFMGLIKFSSSSVAKAQKTFIYAISKEYYEASAIYYLKNMSNEGQEQVIEAQLRSSKVMETMGEKMEQTSSALNKLGESFNGDVIAERVASALSSSIEVTMVPTLEAIKVELATLRDIKEQSQKELVQLLIGEMKSELIEPVTEELSKTSAAVSESNTVTATLNANVERVITTTSETVNTIDGFQKETMAQLQSFAKSLQTILSSFKEDTQGAMSQIATEVNNMLQGASQGMDQQRVAFEQSSQDAASAFEGMKESLELALDQRQVSERALFEDVTTRINALLNETSNSFEAQSTVIAKTGDVATALINKAQEDFETSVELRRDEESYLFGEIEKRISILLHDVSNSFQAQSTVIANTGDAATALMNRAHKDFETSVKLRRDEESHLFGEMETRIANLVASSQMIFKEQADVIKLVGIEASGVMESAKTELQQGLGDIDNKVKSMSETVQSELEAFRVQYQENLTNYFEQQNSLLENSLSKQRNGLNEVVDNFRQVFESEYKARHNLLQELTAQYQNLEASAQTVERVAKAIGLNEVSKMAELQDAAHTMGREIALLKKEYSKAAATFTNVTENLPKAMDDYFTRANESFETFFKDFDQSASTIHNKLSQAASYLITSQVQLREFEAEHELIS